MNFIDIANDILDLIFRVIGLVTIVSTVFVRLTKTDKDDKILNEIKQSLPTIGINPVTKIKK